MITVAVLLIISCIAMETCEHYLYSMAGKFDGKKIFFIIAAVMSHMLTLGIWYMILKLMPIGIALPLMSLSYVTVALTGKLVFKETINFQRWIAIIVIMLGASMVWTGD